MSVNIFKNGKLKKIAGNTEPATVFPMKSEASENDSIIANNNGNSSQIALKIIMDTIEFSGLATADKTLLRAINGIASNLGNIPAYSIDFDTPPNKQIVLASANSTNPPPELGGNTFMLLQIYPTNETYSAQLVWGFSKHMLAMRNRTSAGVWSDWEYFYPNCRGRSYIHKIITSDFDEYCNFIHSANSYFYRADRMVCMTITEAKTNEIYAGSWNNLIHIPYGYRPANNPIFGIGHGLYGQPAASMKAEGEHVAFVKNGIYSDSGTLTIYYSTAWITNDGFPY